MKKLILTLALCCTTVIAYADNTNYQSTGECISAVTGYSTKAYNEMKKDLGNWFDSFSRDSDRVSTKDSVTVRGGCDFLRSNDLDAQKLWAKARSKLNVQVMRLNAGQDTAYGSKAELVCQANPNNQQMNVDTCR
jgi:hypothetical protein